uniref:AAA_6 domain-containing protein n=1 Tax=Echinostoma caproni TaxID=27848 RepID=A0A183BCH0_9TREM
LPGLITGAAEHNKGLGAQFLSLVADCRLLAYVVDVGTLWLSGEAHPNITDRATWLKDQIIQQLAMLQHELGTFDSKLTDRRRCLVVGSKMDLVVPYMNDSNGRHNLWSTVQKAINKATLDMGLLDATNLDRVLLISARRGDNIDALVRCIQQHVRDICKMSNDESS